MKLTKSITIDAATYHADPAYSSTDCKTIIGKSPKIFHAMKYGEEKLDHEPAIKKAFRVGELCHAFTLEPDRAKKAYGVCLSRATKAGKIQAEEMAAKGIEPITDAEYELASNIANEVHAHPIARKLLSKGQAEASFWRTDPETGLVCKARTDFINGDTIVDLKTTGEGGAEPDTFAKSVARYLYHLQAAHYLEVVGAKRFIFIAVEKVYPFAVSVTELDKDSLDYGLSLRQDALKLISQCHTDSYWRGYTEEITKISLPKWAY